MGWQNSRTMFKSNSRSFISEMRNVIFFVLKSKIIFCIYCLIIILLIILPLNGSKELNDITILYFRGDYFFHVLLFIPWAFFNITMKKPWWFWFVLGLFFASCSESIQFFLPYRSFNINDLFANIMGIILGFMFWILFKRFTLLNS